MPQDDILGLTVRQFVIALAILFGSALAAGLVYLALRKVVRRMIERTGTALDNVVVEALERPLILGILLTGLYFFAVSLPLDRGANDVVARVAYPIFAALSIYAGVAIADGLLKWYSQEVAPKTALGLDDRLVPVLRRLIPLVAAILGVLLALELAGIRMPGLWAWLAKHGGRLALLTAFIFLGPIVLSQIIPPVIRRGVAQRGGPEAEVNKRVNTLSAVLVTTAQVLIILVGIFMLLSEIDINIAPVIAGVGVAGIAVGFGAQSLVKDVIAGLFILMEDQYRVGDVVRIADISGLVEEINLRRTVLRDLDGVVHVVPNGEIKAASNFTKEWSRVNLNVEVAYNTDLDHAIAVINRVGDELAQDPQWAPAIIKAPQALRVDNLGASGIEIKILGDTQPIRQWDVMGELRKRLKKAFDEEGIEIPWPHTKVYFGNAPFSAPAAPERK